jgi:hypothetical protein
MRKLTCIAAFFALAFSCANKVEIKKSDLFHESLKGKVKMIEEHYFGAFGTAEATEKGSLANSIMIEFNEEGFRLISGSYTETHYNAEGLKDTIKNLDTNGKCLSYFVNSFNDRGQITRTLMYDEDFNPVYTWVYEYDNEDNIYQDATFDAVGTRLNHNRYLYEKDAHRNWVKRITINAQTNEPMQITERKITYFN